MATKLKKSADGRLFVVYECPHCQGNLRSLAELIGNPTRCKSCGGNHTIPGDELYRTYLKAVQPEPEPFRAPPLRLDIDSDDRLPGPSSRIEPARAKRKTVEYDADPPDEPSFRSPRNSRYPDAVQPVFDDYVAMTSHPGEQIRLQFGPSTAAVLALQIIVGLMAFLWLLIVAGSIITGRQDFRNRPGTAFGGTVILTVYTFAFLVLPSLIALLRILKRKYTITDQRVVSRSGLASLSVNEVRTESISGLTIGQSLFGRLFGYGTVHVYADGTSVRLISVDHPIAVASAIRSVIESNE